MTDDYEITDDLARMDVDAIHDFLKDSYWARGIPRETLSRALANSVCFGVLEDGRQVGFARVVTDRATFGYLADVYVLPGHRGRGLSKRLMDRVMAHPELQGLRRWMLATRDAHGLYERYGFGPMSAPDRMMEIHRPSIYLRGAD